MVNTSMIKVIAAILCCYGIMTAIVVEGRGGITSRVKSRMGTSDQYTYHSFINRKDKQINKQHDKDTRANNLIKEEDEEMEFYRRFQERMLQDGEGPPTGGDQGADEVQAADPEKKLKICSLKDGMEVTRFYSIRERDYFASITDDSELMREHMVETMDNGGLLDGFSNFDDLSNSLNWEGRGLPNNGTTTNMLYLGYSDDRVERRREMWVADTGDAAPFVGTRQEDAIFLDGASTILPWIHDRRAHKDVWNVPHQIGQNEGVAHLAGPQQNFSLYAYTYYQSWGGVTTLFPPFYPIDAENKVGCLGDAWGNFSNARDETYWLWPGLWEENPNRNTMFLDPYGDINDPGLSIMTFISPIYYTGTVNGYDYNDTYVAMACQDVALDTMSIRLHEVEDTLVDGSFAVLVNSQTFSSIVISQNVVEKIYPAVTGNEEYRVERSEATGEPVVDRRNVPYEIGDTIYEPLTDLSNANWTYLRELVLNTPQGTRDSTIMNITLTGDDKAIEHHVMWDRWEYVADWTMLMFAPYEEVENAIVIEFEAPEIVIETIKGKVVTERATLVNRGSLDVVVTARDHPSWFKLHNNDTFDKELLRSGESMTIDFVVETSDLGSITLTSNIAFLVEDYEYNDCHYAQDSFFSLQVTAFDPANLNQIEKIRPVGLTLVSIVVATAIGFTTWIGLNRKNRVVRASQPPFLIMVCVGAIIMGTAIIPLSFDDSNASDKGCDVACMAAPWLIAVGFTVIFSSLFSKIWRINKIMNARQFRRVKVEAKDVLIPFIVLFTLNIILLLCWTFIDPLVWVRKIDGDPRTSRNSYGVCIAEKGPAATTFLVLIIAVNFVALMMACYQAYATRRISDEFSESKYIGVAIVSMVQVLLIGIPVMVIVYDTPPARYLVSSLLVFIVCMSILLLIFVPKIIFMKKAEKKKLKQNANPAGRWKASTSSATESTASSGELTNSWRTMTSARPSGVGGFGQGLRGSDSDGIKIRRFSLVNPRNEQKMDSLTKENASYKQRVAALEKNMRRDGIEVELLFAEVGLPILEPGVVSEANNYDSMGKSVKFQDMSEISNDFTDSSEMKNRTSKGIRLSAEFPETVESDQPNFEHDHGVGDGEGYVEDEPFSDDEDDERKEKHINNGGDVEQPIGDSDKNGEVDGKDKADIAEADKPPADVEQPAAAYDA